LIRSYLSIALGLGLSLHSFADTLVVPSADATMAGGDTSGVIPAPLTIEFQTLIDPSQFSSVKGPISITGFAFRAAPGTGPLNVSVRGSIALSTSPNWPNSSGGHPLISTTFKNNFGTDTVFVVTRGDFTLTSPGCAAPGPCPFATTIPFTNPFVFDPSKGPLLMDATFTFQSATGQFDVADCDPATCVAAGIAAAVGSNASKINYSATVTELTYTSAASATSNVSLNLTATTGDNAAARMFVVGETGSAGALGSAALSLEASSPVSHNAIAPPITIMGSLSFNQLDSINFSFTENDVNFASGPTIALSNGTITGGTGVYAGSTGSLTLNIGQGANASTGSGSLTVGAKTTPLTLSNFHGSVGCSTCELDYSDTTATGTITPGGNVTLTSRLYDQNTPPEPTTGTLTISTSNTDSFNLYLSVAGLGQSVLTFPATVAGGTGAYAGATGSFMLALGQDNSGNLTLQGNGTLTTAPAGAPIITQVKTAYGQPVVAYNTWLQINGQNLAPANTPSTGVDWSSAPDFAQGRMPTQLGPISVTVNGKAAYIYFYCSAATDTSCTSGDQINVLAPLDTTLEGYPVEVIVTRDGVSSAPFAVLKWSLSPAFFVFDTKGHVAARHLDFSFVGPIDLFPGSTTPAKAGETLILVGSGFGPPSGTLIEGSSTQSGSLPATPQCWISGLQANVVAALISPGLYQLNVTVPSGAPSGENLIGCSYQGFPTSPGALITVQ